LRAFFSTPGLWADLVVAAGVGPNEEQFGEGSMLCDFLPGKVI